MRSTWERKVWESTRIRENAAREKEGEGEGRETGSLDGREEDRATSRRVLPHDAQGTTSRASLEGEGEKVEGTFRRGWQRRSFVPRVTWPPSYTKGFSFRRAGDSNNLGQTPAWTRGMPRRVGASIDDARFTRYRYKTKLLFLKLKFPLSIIWENCYLKYSFVNVDFIDLNRLISFDCMCVFRIKFTINLISILNRNFLHSKSAW